MAYTSPDAIFSPGGGQQWNLIPDWSQTTESIQDALIRRANTYVGTSSQRGLLNDAPSGVLWQDTDGGKVLWRREGINWVPTVWRGAGSSSEMNSFSPPNGFQWFNTSDSCNYIRLGGSWVGGKVSVSPASGFSGTIDIISSGGTVQLVFDLTGSFQGDTLLSDPLPQEFLQALPPSGIFPIPAYLDPVSSRSSGAIYISLSSGTIRGSGGGTTITRVRAACSWVL